MAVTGPPQSESKIGRTSNAGWTDVPDVPYDGPSMNLPKLPGGMKWMPQVEAWWEQVRKMPHCVLWTPTDWIFAIETAYQKQDMWLEYFGGQVHASKTVEIRRREDQMGTTVEARRKLLIRYVDPNIDELDAPVAGEGCESPTNVSSIDERRRRLAG
jgi:hypothetical protein